MPNLLKLHKGQLTESQISQYWRDGYLFLYTMITFAFFLLINYKYLY